MNFLSGVMLNNDLLQQIKGNFLWTFFFRLNQNLFCF